MKILQTLLPLVACIGMVTIGTSYGQVGQTKAKPASAKVEKKPLSIVETAIAAKDFKTLVTALKAAELVKTLEGKGPFTVFAPSDKAFAKLPKGTLEDLLKPANQKKLAGILTYHVVAKELMAADVTKMKEIMTVEGRELMVEVKDGKVMINNAQVVSTDIKCTNGVIHVIDTVLLPKE
jgi:transforming growth factor-beta-induced protein